MAQINAFVNIWPGLFVGSCANIELLGVQQENGSYIAGAAVTCVVTDPSGNVVATLNLPYLGRPVLLGPNGVNSYQDGNYRGLLASNVALVAGTTYEFAFSCANPAFQFARYETAAVRNA